MNFVELTAEGGFKTYINLDLIVSLNRNPERNTTMLLTDSKSYFVKETPEEIINKRPNYIGSALA